MKETELLSPTIAYLYPDYSEVDETFTADDLESFVVQVEAETGEMHEIPPHPNPFPRWVEGSDADMPISFPIQLFPHRVR